MMPASRRQLALNDIKEAEGASLIGKISSRDWTQFVIGIMIAVAAASLLNYFIPRLYPWGGEVDLPSHSVSE
jgi:hypothetical protein